LVGAKFDGPLKVWSSFPARIELVNHDPQAKDVKQLVCKLTVPAGVSVGLGGMVVASQRGMSDVTPVMIDDLPTIAESGNNRAPATPQEISLPAAIQGQSEGTTSDYYAFAAKANEAISLDLVAARQGFDFDAVLRVLDATGKELLLLDDDSSTGADCRGVFTAPADGKYLVELRDNRFKAGGKYRLRIGSFPVITATHPLGVQRGVPTGVQFVGAQQSSVPPLTVLTGQSHEPRWQLSTSAGQAGSGWASLVVGDLATVLETASPEPLALPSALHGILSAPKEQDQFTFTLTKGQRVTFTPFTRSAGSPAVLTLRLTDANGTQLAEAAIAENEEEPLSYVAAADGIHRLLVSDLTGRGGPDFTYRIEARLGPTFALLRKVGPAAAKNDPNNNRLRYHAAIENGAFPIDVAAQRYGYDGPIRLAIESNRQGWQTINAVIPAKANEVRLYVLPPLDWEAADIASLRVAGSGDDPLATSITMSTTQQQRLAQPAMLYSPAWSDGLLLVSGVQAKSDFYSVVPAKPTITLLRQVGEVKWNLAMQRTDPAFKDAPLTVLLTKLPPGISGEVKRVGNGPQETYEVTLKSAKDIPAGQHALRYFTYAEHAGISQALASNDVAVTVVDPLSLTVAPAGPLVAGMTQRIKLSVVRNADDRHPVELKFKSLPPGVTGPPAVTLAPEQNEIEVELTASADAAATMFKELAVVGTSKAAGQDVTGESTPVAIEVKKP
jgi:hypothetical protein